jgi:AraC-like DNA-binding protein
VARPRKQIDEALVEKLAALHCTNDEISSVVGCSPDTLERRFAGTIKRGRDRGRTSLKRWQWKAAEGGNVTMMIWLGKQYLGQSDKAEALPYKQQDKGVRLKYRMDDEVRKK